MKEQRPTLLTVVAVFQIIPILLLPPAILASAPPLLFLVPVLFFAFLGWAMLTLRRWALTACLFVQGFNVIARLLLLFPHVQTEIGTDWVYLATSLLSILLSSLIVFFLDRPQIHVAFAGK